MPALTSVVPPALALPPAGLSSSSRQKTHPKDKTVPQVPAKSQDQILRTRYYLLFAAIISGHALLSS